MITDKKQFWKAMKPFFSDKQNSCKKITLIENEKITLNDGEVMELVNTFFPM